MRKEQEIKMAISELQTVYQQFLEMGAGKAALAASLQIGALEWALGIDNLFEKFLEEAQQLTKEATHHDDQETR